jgi:hypothetical protein
MIFCICDSKERGREGDNPIFEKKYIKEYMERVPVFASTAQKPRKHQPHLQEE